MYKHIKRVMDIIFGIICLIVFLIPMIIISIIIKFDSKGPVIFKQIRTGLNGKNFILYKFRSMAVSEKSNQVTKIGRFIRKTGIDELPQLINVIKGDMSFVGPRPWIPEYYDVMNEEQRHRYDVLPGITGLAQVKGRNKINILQKIQYDLEYINNCSLKEDIKIILLTIKTILSKEGVDFDNSLIQNELKDIINYTK